MEEVLRVVLRLSEKPRFAHRWFRVSARANLQYIRHLYSMIVPSNEVNEVDDCSALAVGEDGWSRRR